MDSPNSWANILLQEEKKKNQATWVREEVAPGAQGGDQGEIGRMEEQGRGYMSRVLGLSPDSVCLGCYNQLTVSGVWNEGEAVT